MWTRIKGSLTLRIFLVTCLLLMAACLATYGAIAYLTPISYTSLLEDELRRETGALLAQLEQSDAGQCQAVLTAFFHKTGAEIQVIDQWGQVLYDAAPNRALLTAGTAGAALEEGGETGPESAYVLTAGDSALEQAAQGAWETGFAAEEGDITAAGWADGAVELGEPWQAFSFEDGRKAYLGVWGGRKAVNQAAEAMKQILPFLTLAILGASVLSAFFYAGLITKPIVTISAIAARIAGQDFDARWTDQRSDEIGRLGESLNALSDNLSGALTRLQEANAALRQDVERERETERQRSAFFSAASHELKTPVTILKGQLSGMLAQIGVYRDREKYLARALEVTGRMESLIQEILTISRIQSGSFSLEAGEIDLGALLHRQLEMDRELLEQKRLSLEQRIALPTMVRGHPGLLANAMDNLLMNAILYSPPGACVRVTLEGRRLTIENTGVYIPLQALPQLFTPFYRVEPSRNRQSGGSGLGLYLVGSILSLHRASYQIQNIRDGVRFQALFP